MEDVEAKIHSFLTYAIDGGGYSASSLGRFVPGKSSLIHDEYMLGPRVGIDVKGNREYRVTARNEPTTSRCSRPLA
jgi:3-methyladenine DNA glycosylase Mpg